MKIVKVTYTTSEAYSAQNKANIQAVMNDLRQLANPGINYHVCVGPDDKTFTHTAFFTSEERQKILFALPSFQDFQEQVRASGLEAPPITEHLTLVGSSKDIF